MNLSIMLLSNYVMNEGRIPQDPGIFRADDQVASTGVHQMHMTTMDAPDIRYSALNTMPEMQHSSTPYSLANFKSAVEDGKHPDGEELNSDMPRWSMSNADLQDLLAFLKTLP